MSRDHRFLSGSFLLLCVPAFAVSTAAPLAAPSNLVAVKSPASPKTAIDLSWTDNSDHEAGFRIEQCNGAGCSYFVFAGQVGANITTAQFFDLPGGTTFRYRVQAFDDFGVSPYSNEAEAATDPLQPPQGAPTSLTATSTSSDRVLLTWQDNSATEDRFEIERCTGNGCTVFQTIGLVGPNVTGFQDVEVSPNTTYRYQVRAMNSDGSSGYSNVATATTADGPPNAPQGLAAFEHRKGGRVWIELSWTDASSDETSFELERCRGASCSDFAVLAVLSSNLTRFTDTSASRRSTYRYRIRATRGLQKSSYSNVAAATTR